MEINLYQALDRDSAERFMSYLGWASANEVFITNIFCEGGQILPSWGIAAKLNEAKARGVVLRANIHGMCASMATVLLPFFDQVTALDLSAQSIMLHRGSFPDTDDDGEKITVTPALQNAITAMNADIYKVLASKIDDKKLRELKGYGLSELFDEKKPLMDCYLTAQEAHAIGLVHKLVPLTTDTYKIHNAAASAYMIKATAAKAETINRTKMDLNTLKTLHPEVYAQAVAEGVAQGKAQAPVATPQSAAVDATAVEAAVVAALAKMGITALAATAAGSPVAVQASAIVEAEAKKQAEAKAAADAKETEAVAKVAAELSTVLKLV